MSEEVWRKVVGYEHSHEVSNLGRVRSIDRIIVHKDYAYQSGLVKKGRTYRKRGKVLNLTLHRGYAIAAVGKNKTAVHRLVAKAFIPNPKNKRTVNHKNGVKSDNRVENLEWATYKEQSVHAHTTGLIDNSKKSCPGSLNPKAKLTESQIPKIRKELLKRPRNVYITDYCKKLAKKYKVSDSTIWGIKMNRNWTHV